MDYNDTLFWPRRLACAMRSLAIVITIVQSLFLSFFLSFLSSVFCFWPNRGIFRVWKFVSPQYFGICKINLGNFYFFLFKWLSSFFVVFFRSAFGHGRLGQLQSLEYFILSCQKNQDFSERSRSHVQCKYCHQHTGRNIEIDFISGLICPQKCAYLWFFLSKLDLNFKCAWPWAVGHMYLQILEDCILAVLFPEAMQTLSAGNITILQEI